MICEEDGNFLGFHDKDFIESHKGGLCFLARKGVLYYNEAKGDVYLKRGDPIV